MSDQGFSPEFAKTYCAMMLDGVLREAEITKRVIAAVPDAASGYKPDPNSRTAKELAWHLANTDIQFLDGNSRKQAGELGGHGRLVRGEHQARCGARSGADAGTTADAGQLRGNI